MINQLNPFLIICGVREYEVWTEKEYRLTHSHTKKFRSHMLASKKMNLLAESGMDYKDAQKWIILEGKQRINRKELSILGTPFWAEKVRELPDKVDFQNLQICNCCIEGIFRRKIILIVKENYD